MKPTSVVTKDQKSHRELIGRQIIEKDILPLLINHFHFQTLLNADKKKNVNMKTLSIKEYLAHEQLVICKAGEQSKS